MLFYKRKSKKYIQILFWYILTLACTSYEIWNHLDGEYKNSMFNKKEEVNILHIKIENSKKLCWELQLRNYATTSCYLWGPIVGYKFILGQSWNCTFAK